MKKQNLLILIALLFSNYGQAEIYLRNCPQEFVNVVQNEVTDTLKNIHELMDPLYWVVPYSYVNVSGWNVPEAFELSVDPKYLDRMQDMAYHNKIYVKCVSKDHLLCKSKKAGFANKFVQIVGLNEMLICNKYLKSSYTRCGMVELFTHELAHLAGVLGQLNHNNPNPNFDELYQKDNVFKIGLAAQSRCQYLQKNQRD